jgi:hypothetical protein
MDPTATSREAMGMAANYLLALCSTKWAMSLVLNQKAAALSFS